MQAHLSEIRLRQLFAGENVDAQSKEHGASCPDCRTRLKALEEEQKRFESAISFERFALGVERVTRTAASSVQRHPLIRFAPALAAGLLALIGTTVLLAGRADSGPNRLKGGAHVNLVIGGVSGAGQRSAATATVEALAPQERVLINYEAANHRYLVAVSIDETGEVSSFPEGPAPWSINGKGQLPESLQFTGSGLEHLVVLLTPEPLSVEEIRHRLKARFDEARGQLNQMGSLDVPGDQFHYTFRKP